MLRLSEEGAKENDKSGFCYESKNIKYNLGLEHKV